MVNGFHPEPMEVTTIMPLRGTRHLKVSSLLALKHWAFVRNHVPPTMVNPTPTNQASRTRSESLHCRNIDDPKVPHRLLLAIHTAKETNHHHCNIAHQ
jgi:hypothetical protein